MENEIIEYQVNLDKTEWVTVKKVEHTEQNFMKGHEVWALDFIEKNKDKYKTIHTRAIIQNENTESGLTEFAMTTLADPPEEIHYEGILDEDAEWFDEDGNRTDFFGNPLPVEMNEDAR